MNVFAYGVVPTNPPETYRNYRGETRTVMYPKRYLHYWIDENFQHQSEVKNHPYLPDDLGWINRAGVSVDLRGPFNYMIKREGV
jgi:hypothetical protein